MPDTRLSPAAGQVATTGAQTVGGALTVSGATTLEALTANGNVKIKGPLPWVDVTAFGATGDGTTDDTTSIANAAATINATTGGRLFFPAGTYVVTGDPGLNLGSKNNLHILGAGWSTVIKLTGSTGTPALLGVGDQSNLTVSNIQLWNAVTAVRTDHVKGSLTATNRNWLFENVYFRSDGSAAGSQPYIFNVDGGAAGRLSTVAIRNCFIENRATSTTLQVSGLLVRGVYDLSVVGNTFRNINNPIVPDSSYQKEGLVYANNLEIVDQDTVHSEGPDIWGTNKVVYTGNVQRDVVAHSGDTRSCGGCLIDTGSGVGCTDVTITGNVFVRNPIQLNPKSGAGNVVKNVVVQGNVIEGQRTGAGYNADIVLYDPGVTGQFDNVVIHSNILRGTATNRFLFPAAANITNLHIGPNLGPTGQFLRLATTEVAWDAAVSGDTNKRIRVLGDGTIEWGSGSATPDVNLYRGAANRLQTDDALLVTGTLEANAVLRFASGGTGYVEGFEITAPAAPAANSGRLYFEDNGAGKTRLVVLFPTGAAQVLATEP